MSKRVEINYVIETETVLNIMQEEQQAQAHDFRLIDKKTFYTDYLTGLDYSEIDSNQLWDCLLGNYPKTNESGLHPQVHYLSEDACDIIVNHLHQFKESGLDYQNLPAGFFMARNPIEGGGRDVLHYSDFLATNTTQHNPLAIQLTTKDSLEVPLKAHLSFESPKREWYEFLVNLAKPNPCTQKQLDAAFIHFANKIEAHGLSFFKADFSKLTNSNPITLLGRWHTVLFNRHLKSEDRIQQWQELPRLPLHQSYNAIRAITDHMHHKKNCGFLLTDMNLDMVISFYNSEKYLGYNTVAIENQIRNKDNFWRYIAFMPKRNSIDFYRRALKAIPVTLGRYDGSLYRMLAAATTGDNHLAKNSEEEEKELKIWLGVCELIQNIESCSTVIKIFLASTKGHGSVQRDFLSHLTRLNKQPNIPFLSVIAQHITDFIAGLGASNLAQIARGVSPLQKLEELSNKLNSCVNNQGTSFYQGCRFYLVEGTWQKMSTQSYIELAHCIDEQMPREFSSIFIPLISTFGVTDARSIIDIVGPTLKKIESSSDMLTKKLAFFTAIFRDVNTPLKIEQLKKILTDISATTLRDEPLAMLSYFEQHFSDYFNEEYFTKQKRLFEDAANGLNERQIALLQGYQFEENDLNLLVQLESAMVRRHPMMADEELVQLNDQFFVLTEVLMPSEFSEFLQHLLFFRDCIPDDSDELTQLLQQVIKKKSLTSFNVAFLRNTKEQIKDASLLPKINKYIAVEQHITSKNWTINPILLQETLATLILRLPPNLVREENVASELTAIIDQLNEIATRHPHAQQQTIHLVNNLVRSEDDYFNKTRTLLRQLVELTDILPPGSDKLHRDNMSVFYSLTSHYQAVPNDLITLFNVLEGLDQDQKRFFLLFITRLLNSEQSTEHFEELVELCRNDNDKMLLLQQHCCTPPYASIKELHNWLTSNTFAQNYDTFCLSPYGKRHSNYRFDLNQYGRQRHQFQGVSDEIFTKELGIELDRMLKENRSKEMSALFRTIKELKSKSDYNEQDLQVLLTTTIEVLARTAHQHDSSSPTGTCSQEMNTTQVMAAYAMLFTGQNHNRIINQVDTGEGKSRIMMVLSGIQAIRGKTVDFITSNIILAERDYFTYQEFFNALDIPTGLISLSTPPQLYRKGGVNFSDNPSLILLRNKSDINLSSTDYLDEDKNQRCLMLDEEDKFVHDKSSHAFNFAARSKSLAGFVWVYPLLVGFMQASQHVAVDNALIDAFLTYVSLHDNDQLHQASLANLKRNNPEQLKIWLRSALTALNLKQNVDYVLTSAEEDKLFPVRNIEGLTCYTRQLLVLENGRPMEGSNYSDGVHQCLCAIENQKAGKEGFVIMPENETQRTMYTHPFLKTYQAIYGVSGSTRAQGPMAHPEINQDNWQYMITPREKPLRRQDKRVWAAKDEQQHIAFIKDEIVEACKKGQSFLLVCRNDKQSQYLNDELKKDPTLQTLVKQWQHVHGLTSALDEKSAVEQGGTPGYVTISNVGLFSRGVDIRAQNMKVRSAFVPTIEDEIQIKGRTGRFGKEGDYRMVINLQDEEARLDGRNYNIEARVIAKQRELAIAASIEEKTASLYAEFQEKVHQAFLAQYAKTIVNERPSMLKQWQDLLDSMQKDWELKRVDIKQALDNQDLSEFKKQFSSFTSSWRTQMRAKVAKSAAMPMELDLPDNYFNCIQAHRGFFADHAKNQTIKTKRAYDKADDGQATIYQMPFAQTLATLKGERPFFANTRASREGRGVLFPDLKATLNGERPIFANLRAFIHYLWQLITNSLNNEQEQEPASPLEVNA